MVLERLGREQRARPIDAVADSTGRVVVAWSGSDGAALDPATGRPTIVWSNRPEGSGGPVAQIATLAQAATRSE